MSSVASASTWTTFIKSIASYNGDLSSLTAPPFIVSPVSQVEYSQYWAEHTDLLLAPNFITGEDEDEVALERMVAVVKWFISTLRSQYCTRNETMGGEKKPLNPFLGEIFVGKWVDESEDKRLGETVLVSEQVSHHPPVTGYAVINDQNKTLLQGYNKVTAYMSSTALNVKQFGHAILDFQKLEEQYLITLPQLHIEGIFAFSPFVELDGKSYIQSSTGYLAVIEYSGRGYFSGKKNSFKARIFRDKASSGDKENAICTISGQWSGVSGISGGPKRPSVKGGDDIFFDAHSTEPQHLVVKPIQEQHHLESRRAWQSVAAAVKEGNYDLIVQEKSKLENEQRALRRAEADSGTEWDVRWFDIVDLEDTADLVASGKPQDPLVSLAQVASLSTKNVTSGTAKGDKDDLKTEVGSKHWRFNTEKFAAETEVKV